MSNQVDQITKHSSGEAVSPPHSALEQGTPWYVGAMNDGYFVIDQKPQPAPVDYVCEMDHDVNVIAACGAREDIANLLVAEHNAKLALVNAARFAADVLTPYPIRSHAGNAQQVEDERRARESLIAALALAKVNAPAPTGSDQDSGA